MADVVYLRWCWDKKVRMTAQSWRSRNCWRDICDGGLRWRRRHWAPLCLCAGGTVPGSWVTKRVGAYKCLNRKSVDYAPSAPKGRHIQKGILGTQAATRQRGTEVLVHLIDRTGGQRGQNRGSRNKRLLSNLCNHPLLDAYCMWCQFRPGTKRNNPVAAFMSAVQRWLLVLVLVRMGSTSPAWAGLKTTNGIPTPASTVDSSIGPDYFPSSIAKIPGVAQRSHRAENPRQKPSPRSPEFEPPLCISPHPPPPNRSNWPLPTEAGP